MCIEVSWLINGHQNNICFNISFMTLSKGTVMLNKILNDHLNKLEEDPDIEYLKGVTPATLFRFLNGSVYLDNIRKTAINSVLITFEDFNDRDLLLPFFADMRYRGRGLKTDDYKKSLLGNYLKIYYPMHLKANMYHDEFISKQISMVEKCLQLCEGRLLANEQHVKDEVEKVSNSYSFFPTVKGFYSDNKAMCKKVMSDLKEKGMDSLYGINHEMVDALMHCIQIGLDNVMNLCDARNHPERLLEYALALYKECQNDAKTFEYNFEIGRYGEVRKILEKKIAFDTVFVYLLLFELRDMLPNDHILCREGCLSPERRTTFYLSRRFSMSSSVVLRMQKKIVMKCILFSILNRMKKDHRKEYKLVDLHSEIGIHFGWLDTNDERRYEKVQNVLSQDKDSTYLTDKLFQARNPIP